MKEFALLVAGFGLGVYLSNKLSDIKALKAENALLKARAQETK